MAKKSRRARRSASSARRSPRAPSGTKAERLEKGVVEAGELPVRPVRELARSRSASAGQPVIHADFRAEYPYVVQDLKRIAVLAGTMLGALIVLSFVLH
jgi:hypothetical protein